MTTAVTSKRTYRATTPSINIKTQLVEGVWSTFTDSICINLLQIYEKDY